MYHSSDSGLVCPICESGELCPQDAPGVFRCAACGVVPGRAVLETLWHRIAVDHLIVISGLVDVDRTGGP